MRGPARFLNRAGMRIALHASLPLTPRLGATLLLELLPFTPRLGATLLLGLLPLLGCGGVDSGTSGGAAAGSGGGTTTTDTGGSAGSGGTTSTGVTGGSGGGGSGGQTSTGGSGGQTSTGGSGGGTGTITDDPDSVALCEALCSTPCVGNTCVFERTLELGALNATNILSDGTTSDYGMGQACTLEAMVVANESLLRDGPCWLVSQTLVEGTFQFLPFDLGTITVSSPTAGTVALPPKGNCYNAKTVGPILSPGETVTADVPGNIDVSPFSLEVTAPGPLSVTTSALVPGQPLTVSWAPAGPISYVFLSSATASIYCDPGASGEVTLSGALTGALAAGSGLATLTVQHVNTVESSFGPTNERVNLGAGYATIRLFNY